MTPTSPSPKPVQDRQGLELSEQEPKTSLRDRLSQPATLAALVIGLAIAGFVAWLEIADSGNTLTVPEVSYTLMPNEGRTGGVPIAIKLSHVTVFVIDDPLTEQSGATRAKALVERFQNMVSDLRENPGRAITYTTDTGLPAIVLQNPDLTDRKTLVQLTQDDVTQAGGGDPKMVARVWAERLTDALKVFAFGEPPEFSTGTEYGDSLQALYAMAREIGGTISKNSLDGAFEKLTDGQRLALETMPQIARGPTQTAASVQ
jgi:hypothetical protein